MCPSNEAPDVWAYRMAVQALWPSGVSRDEEDEAMTKTYRWWFCFCGEFYTGKGPAEVYEEKPDDNQCHQMGGCGWREVTEVEEL